MTQENLKNENENDFASNKNEENLDNQESENKEEIIDEVEGSEDNPEANDQNSEQQEEENLDSNNEEEESAPEMSLEDQVKDLEDRNLRLLAEMQNIRSRHQKDMKEAREFAVTSFAQDMILVLENINRAKESIPDGDNQVYKNILEGINMIREEVINVFTKQGIERVAPEVGDDFDYKIHQAVVQIPTNEVAEGKVCQLIHAGYLMKERVLRPAMVGVAKKVEEFKEADSE
jgi:molecular chaperone GrpE